MKKIGIIISFLIIFITIYFVYQNKFKVSLDIFNNLVEINKEYKINEFVKVKNGEIVNGEKNTKFTELKYEILDIEIKNRLNKIEKKQIVLKVIDTEKPIIECENKITTTIGKKIDLLKNVKVTDNSLEEIVPKIEGKYNLKKTGTYKLKYIAEDKSGNKEEKDFTLTVKNTSAKTVKSTTNNSKYYIKINKTLNVVMVYTKDDNNNYNKLVKTFVASAGKNTPTGEFKTDAKAKTLALEGGVYGHYTVRFLKSRGMWFHSVPYFSKPADGHWNDLEYEEYNKLGTLASLGCIRLAVIDAKWIYENIPNGTTVEIYESDTLPTGVVKPTPIKIDVNSENRGWDPTDPDAENPWLKK